MPLRTDAARMTVRGGCVIPADSQLRLPSRPYTCIFLLLVAAIPACESYGGLCLLQATTETVTTKLGEVYDTVATTVTKVRAGA